MVWNTPASGLKDITHGVGLAVIEPVVVEYTWSANPDKFGVLARIFNHGDGSELGEALRFIVHDLDLTTNLTELGFTKKDIPWLVDNVYVVATGNIANTVAEINRKDIEELYKKNVLNVEVVISVVIIGESFVPRILWPINGYAMRMVYYVI